MSHFSVLVIGGNLDEQLERYQENNIDTCCQDFLEFVEAGEEYSLQYAALSDEEKKEYPAFDVYMRSFGFEILSAFLVNP